MSAKFTANRKDLLKALSIVKKPVSSKSSLSILRGVLIKVQQEQILLSTTDLEFSITAKVLNCNISEIGEFVINHKVFSNILKSSPDQNITFEIEQKQLIIIEQAGESKVSIISADEFPKLPKIDFKNQIKINSADFIDLVNKSLFAIDNNKSRPELCGVLWQIKETPMIMVATNGHYLARIAAENPNIREQDDVIIPSDILIVLRQIMPKNTNKGGILKDNNLGVIFSKEYITFIYQGIILSERLIEGSYPNYKQVIPEKGDKILTVKKSDLIVALMGVWPALNETKTVIFNLTGKECGVLLQASNASKGLNISKICTGMYIGDVPFVIRFNAHYIRDILNVIEGDNVTMEFIDPTSACLIYSDKIKKEKILYVQMPLRLEK